MKNVGFHVLWEQTHIFFPSSLQSFCWWVNIVLSIDGIHMLANVVIADPTQTYFVSQVAVSCGVTVLVMVQVKKGLHCDHYPTNMFFLLAINVFGCFH
jgi:hypothetical protein